MLTAASSQRRVEDLTLKMMQRTILPRIDVRADGVDINRSEVDWAAIGSTKNGAKLAS